MNIQFDPRAMELYLKKIDMYRKEETLNFEKIREIFNLLSNNYRNEISEKFDEVFMDLDNKMRVISTNHINYTYVLNRKLEQYEQVEGKNIELLSDSRIIR